MRHFERSLGIRHLVCGSCNACEHEMNALSGPDYDITACGWDIVASPRHADVISVTGPMTEAMADPAMQTLDAAARPNVVIAIGDCAIGAGVWCENGSGAGTKLGAVVKVPGCPPTPEAIKAGLVKATRRD